MDAGAHTPALSNAQPQTSGNFQQTTTHNVNLEQAPVQPVQPNVNINATQVQQQRTGNSIQDYLRRQQNKNT